jgi:hypothetical protein
MTWIKENISSDGDEISSEFIMLSSIDFLISELIKMKLLSYSYTIVKPVLCS